MNINITSGECLTVILKELYPSEPFVPFNEAMIRGTYSAPLFSDAFIEERCRTHGASREEYIAKLGGFMDVLRRAEAYDAITLWFGDEPFCVENRRVVIAALRAYGYRGSITLHIVDEETGRILRTEEC